MVDQYNITSTQKANLETARIEWQSLQRQFAQGLLLLVDTSCDLVNTAGCFIDDDKGHVEALLSEGLLRKASMEDAARWQENDAVLWAVVVAPWVLVQDINQ